MNVCVFKSPKLILLLCAPRFLVLFLFQRNRRTVAAEYRTSSQATILRSSTYQTKSRQTFFKTYRLPFNLPWHFQSKCKFCPADFFVPIGLEEEKDVAVITA